MTESLTIADAATLLGAARFDPLPFMRDYLQIRTKAKTVVPLALNTGQRECARILQEQRDAGKPVRGICLKARQLGISTETAGFITTGCITFPGSKGIILSYERSHTEKLSLIYDLFLRMMPPWLGLQAKYTKKHIHFSHLKCADGLLPIDSNLWIDTATGKETARGDTLHWCHLSEFGFYPDADKTALGVLGAVPDDPDTFVMIESTANGMVGIGQPFKERWEAAKNGEGEYLPIFLPWFIEPLYRVQAPEDFESTREEKLLAAEHSLDHDQLMWRRVKIAGFNGDIEKFQQEFPSTDVEAFIVSGHRALPTSVLLEYKSAARKLPPPTTGEFEKPAIGGPTIFVPRSHGRWRIFEPLVKGHEYALGVDTSLGLGDGDPSAAAVLDRTVVRFVASFIGFVDPRLYAHELNAVGRYYLNALCAVETNNTGLSTLNELVEHLHYPNPMVWRRFDNLKNIYTDKLGWETNWRTRQYMIDNMGWALKTHYVGISDAKALDQMIDLDAGTDRSGKDDLAIAHCIAMIAHLSNPMRNGRLPREVLEGKVAADAKAPMPQDALNRAAWEDVDRALASATRQGAAGDAMVADGDHYYGDDDGVLSDEF